VLLNHLYQPNVHVFNAKMAVFFMNCSGLLVVKYYDLCENSIIIILYQTGDMK